MSFFNIWTVASGWRTAYMSGVLPLESLIARTVSAAGCR